EPHAAPARRIITNLRPKLGNEAQPGPAKSTREQNVLMAAGRVGDRSAAEAGACIEAPKLLSGCRIVRQGVALQVTGKEQAAAGGEQAAVHRLVEFELPLYLARERVPRVEVAISFCARRVLSFRRATIIKAGEWHRLRLHPLDIEGVTRLDDVLVQQARLRTIGRCLPTADQPRTGMIGYAHLGR